MTIATIHFSVISTLPNLKMSKGTASSSAEVTSMIVTDAEAQGWDEEATKRLLWRLDWHIIPFMSLIYLYAQSR